MQSKTPRNSRSEGFYYMIRGKNDEQCLGGSSCLLRFCTFIIAGIARKVKYFGEKRKKIFF